jgi:hypothetical protein
MSKPIAALISLITLTAVPALAAEVSGQGSAKLSSDNACYIAAKEALGRLFADPSATDGYFAGDYAFRKIRRSADKDRIETCSLTIAYGPGVVEPKADRDSPEMFEVSHGYQEPSQPDTGDGECSQRLEKSWVTTALSLCAEKNRGAKTYRPLYSRFLKGSPKGGCWIERRIVCGLYAMSPQESGTARGPTREEACRNAHEIVTTSLENRCSAEKLVLERTRTSFYRDTVVKTAGVDSPWSCTAVGAGVCFAPNR